MNNLKKLICLGLVSVNIGSPQAIAAMAVIEPQPVGCIEGSGYSYINPNDGRPYNCWCNGGDGRYHCAPAMI